MNKPYRFMIEYANYSKRYLDGMELINDGIRVEMKRRIDRALSMYEQGFITVDETMRLIADPCSLGEDMAQYMTAWPGTR